MLQTQFATGAPAAAPGGSQGGLPPPGAGGRPTPRDRAEEAWGDSPPFCPKKEDPVTAARGDTASATGASARAYEDRAVPGGGAYVRSRLVSGGRCPETPSWEPLGPMCGWCGGGRRASAPPTPPGGDP